MESAQIERFWSRVVKSDGCWEWQGALSAFGHGVGWDGKRTRLAHRIAWFLTHGEWPALCVCHRCDNPRCCNPEHLFLGTRSDNLADMRAKGRQAPMPRKRGAEHHKTPFDEIDVRQIRKAIAARESYSSVARRYGVSHVAIRNIWLRKSWAHVP